MIQSSIKAKAKMLTEEIKNNVHLQTKAPTHVQTFVKMYWTSSTENNLDYFYDLFWVLSQAN